MSEERVNSIKKLILTCGRCGNYPMVIEGIRKYPYSKEYSMSLKCTKCGDYSIKSIAEDVFEKLGIEKW